MEAYNSMDCDYCGCKNLKESQTAACVRPQCPFKFKSAAQRAEDFKVEHKGLPNIDPEPLRNKKESRIVPQGWKKALQFENADAEPPGHTHFKCSGKPLIPNKDKHEEPPIATYEQKLLNDISELEKKANTLETIKSFLKLSGANRKIISEIIERLRELEHNEEA